MSEGNSKTMREYEEELVKQQNLLFQSNERECASDGINQNI